MVTPNLIKFAVSNLDENGKTVGVIEALNTIGSIIGTFLPTFVTIPNIGTSLTFIIFASLLYTICLIYFIFRKKFIIRTSTIVVVALTLGILSNQIGFSYWENNIIYEGESIYNYLRVEETDDSIILSTNVLFGVQSIKMKNGGLTGMYYDYALAAPTMAQAEDDNLDMLILGLGTGTFATQCLEYYDNVTIDGVEIDGKIVDLAREYFSLPEEVNTYVDDGRAFLTLTEKKYDVIMVDAYQDITIPFQMSSIEFFTLVKEHLTDKGVMIVNMNMYSNNEGGINDYLCGTIRSVFDSVYTAGVGTNVELFASNAYDCKDELIKGIDNISNNQLKTMMNRVENNLQKRDSTKYILTDDKAPVELLGMRVLDQMIVNELDYYRQKLKGMTIQEIIEMLISGQLF